MRIEHRRIRSFTCVLALGVLALPTLMAAVGPALATDAAAAPSTARATGAMGITGATGTASSGQAVYMDTRRSFEDRAADLVARMTLEEKVSQLQNDAAA